MTTTLGQMISYLDELPSIKSPDPSIEQFCKVAR